MSHKNLVSSKYCPPELARLAAIVTYFLQFLVRADFDGRCPTLDMTARHFRYELRRGGKIFSSKFGARARGVDRATNDVQREGMPIFQDTTCPRDANYLT